jgi:hypothetical protein
MLGRKKGDKGLLENESYASDYASDQPEQYGTIEEDLHLHECPSCGKVPHGKMCIHCGANTLKRLKETTLLAWALVLMLLGTSLFIMAMNVAEPEIREICSIDQDDAYENLRIMGTVVSAPNYYVEKYEPDTGVARFTVNDTTGEINVKLETPVVKEIRKEGRVPGVGDVIDVRGTVYLGDDGWMQMTCITPEFLRITKREYTPMAISQISGAGESDLEKYSQVEVEGTISYVYESDYSIRFNLEDNDGNEVVCFMRTTIVQLTDDDGIADNVSYGAFVTVRGALEYYKPWYSTTGYWEVIPTSAHSIKMQGVAPKVDYPVYSISDLMLNPDENEGLLVRIENVVAYEIDSWNLFMVADPDTGANISIYIEYGANMTGDIFLDAVIDVQGSFTKYYDIYELKVRAGKSDFVEIKGVST